MRAVHWLRSRQEERELSFWLSIVSYDPRDRSLTNRIYLLYLIIFFSAWVFATLLIFANAGAVLLRTLDPLDPAHAALCLELLLLAIWSCVSFWHATRRSPLVFSEQDELLICQTPVDRRHVALRWLLMPWIKSAIPFWLAAITLGFSLAETSMPGVMLVSRILEYGGYGLRAWLVIIPIHLAVFALQWAAGILRLQKDDRRRWLAWLVNPLVLSFFSLLLVYVWKGNQLFFSFFGTILKAFTYPLLAGFVSANISIPLLSAGLFALAALGILFWSSGTLNLSRAAQETRAADTISVAHRYGLNDYANQLQDQQRLGVKHAPSRLPTVTGAGILIWKDVLQSQRSFRPASLYIWGRIFLLMLGLALLPDLASRDLAIGIWVIQLGQVSVIRIRGDLTCWPLTRQLPISYKKFLLFDLAPAYFLALLVSVGGLLIGSLAFNTASTASAASAGLALLLPGMGASVAGMAALDVIRRARSNLLIDGSVPELGAGGIILGLISAAVPVLLHNFVPGMMGMSLAILSSIGIGILAVSLAARAYHSMNAS